MVASRNFLTALSGVLASAKLTTAEPTNAFRLDVRAADPCAAIANQTWVAPKDVRACFASFPLDGTVKANTIEVVNKTFAFHTSVNYERNAPAPFTEQVHEDVLADLARISGQSYGNELDFHIDLSRSVKRLNDGHCAYINQCYDSLFVTYLPTPLVFLTDETGNQTVHIAPEAFDVAKEGFKDELDVWQNALPDALKGKLSSLSGARVLAINGEDPLAAVDANAQIAGGYQGLSTRQNGFFASYNSAVTGWTYIMGNFAQQSLPLVDAVTLTVQLTNSSEPQTITLPYRSRISKSAKQWTDSASFRQNNCVAIPGTNGVDVKYRQAPVPQGIDTRKLRLDVILDATPLQNIALPPELIPRKPLAGSTGVTQFHLLDDGKTGVLALGNFLGGTDQTGLMQDLITGLQNLKKEGATQLIIDVSNNGGGHICVVNWLHRIIAGPKDTTEPQAALDTAARDGPLAQLIAQAVAKGADPDNNLMYNSANWKSANSTPFPAGLINGVQDAFSQRLGDECLPFDLDPPPEALFDTKKVAIVSNGRCASSCSLLSITLAKKEGSKTVVYGGRNGIEQQYCGTVGGQSSDFSTIDTEIKTTKLKNHTLAPPDFVSNSVFGITWRLAFGVENTEEPEEWQNHPADVNLPLTAEIVNKPFAIWTQVAKDVLQ
ncbi:hypothetical protein BD413DRAFT_655923 [Trametes elegans]|nr:hypothetical protein BD413DRAFT_655923 [Trametes elegans]